MLETKLNNINQIINNMTILNNINNEKEKNNDELDNNEKEEINDELDNNEKEDSINEDLIEDEEIEYKGKIYFLNNDNVYIKLNNSSKEPIYGTYKNGKVKKIKITEITI